MVLGPGAKLEYHRAIFYIRQVMAPILPYAPILCYTTLTITHLDVSDAGNQRKGPQLVDTGSSCLVEITPTDVPLLIDNADDNPVGALASSVSVLQDGSSCGTVIRHSEQLASRSLSSVQELHENGIVFDNSAGGRRRDDEDIESLQELAQSTGNTGVKGRHITFASPPAAPAIRGPRPVTPVRSLSPDQLKEPDFHSPRPAADPREERQLETKASNPGTKDRDKDTYGVLSVRQCNDMSTWIRKRALKSSASEECPFRERLLRDQIKLSGDSALVENRLPQAYKPNLSAETVNGGQTLELIVEATWSMAQNTTKNTHCLEVTHRSNFTIKQQTITFPSSANKDPATTIYDLPTMSPTRDPIQDQNAMLTLLGKADSDVVELTREDGLSRKVNAYSQKMSTETLEGGRNMRTPQEGAGKRTSAVGSASSTTAVFDNQPRRDSTDKDRKVPNRHVREALERLRKNKSWVDSWNSWMPPTPSSSSNSQIHRVDTQGHDSTPIRQHPRRLTKRQQLERVVDELLIESCTVPTSTSTSALQESRITASGMMDAAAWDIHLNIVMPGGKEQHQMPQKPGHHGEDDEGGAVQVSGGPREKVVLVVAHVMVLSVKLIRLYRHHLCSCLSPRSELWDRIHSGTVTPLEAVAVITTIWVTFYILFGLYMAFLCFCGVLQNIWENETYDY